MKKPVQSLMPNEFIQAENVMELLCYIDLMSFMRVWRSTRAKKSQHMKKIKWKTYFIRGTACVKGNIEKLKEEGRAICWRYTSEPQCRKEGDDRVELSQCAVPSKEDWAVLFGSLCARVSDRILLSTNKVTALVSSSCSVICKNQSVGSLALVQCNDNFNIQ